VRMPVAGFRCSDATRDEARGMSRAIAGAPLAVRSRMATNDRPRERLWNRGVQMIGDEELLSLVLGTGVRARPALAIASDLVRATGGVAALSRASPRELALVTGVGTARATRVAAAFELGRRAMESEQRRELLGR